jgi:hypothetical protein
MRFRVWNTSSLVTLTADYINTAVFCIQFMDLMMSKLAARTSTRENSKPLIRVRKVLSDGRQHADSVGRRGVAAASGSQQ